ncbi:hypothetical protein IWW56_001181 [Coemansia sp. RSA 2131]|nr:hypothetical protein IWW56_001181 [Coemansia sp. RSA 2131]
MSAEEHQPGDFQSQRRQDNVLGGDSSTWIPANNAAHDNTVGEDAQLQHELNDANGRPEHEQSAMGEQTAIRYSVDELLALRESKLVYAPDNFSANAPLRPGVQVKMVETARSVGGVRSQVRNPYIGLEHIVGAQRSTVQPVRAGGQAQRGVGARGGFTEHSGMDRARTGYTDHGDRVRTGFVDHEVPRGGYSARGGQQAPGGRNGRTQASGRHEGGMAAASWRTRTAGTGDVAQPEWMDDGVVYDEGQSARQMQDMEEWKRRMREGADVVAPQVPMDDQAAQRESRFLRLFTASEPQTQVSSTAAATSRASDDDEQLSKLFKVFGSKVNVSSKANADSTAASSTTANSTLAPVSETQRETQRETGSPAPINEALRGIVPTSVFRKSAKGAARRPDSTSSSRSATPARSLPSWLVELSRGSPAQAPDLVDTLEREYPALGAQALGVQALDAQSISSLSVQASGGAPSEANGSVGSGSSQPMGMDSQAVSQAIISQAAMAQAISQPMAQAISQPMGQGNTQPILQQMGPGNTPMGMMGMPHMMMPGMNPALGQLPMPMGPPMGFHPNMMYGMPMPGMMGMPHMNDQLMLMKMMSDPPMYGQMSAPPNMPHIAHSYGHMQYPSMPPDVSQPGQPFPPQRHQE